MLRYANQYGYPHYWFVNPIGLSGGLFLLWKDGTVFEIVDNNKFFIVCLVQFDATIDKTLLVCMYGSLDDGIARQCEFLSRLSGRFQCPWVIIGDLNFITRREEKIGGNPVSQSQLDAMNDHFDFLSLNDINFVGNPYARSNRRSENSVTFERIDIALGNVNWFDVFPIKLCCISFDCSW